MARSRRRLLWLLLIPLVLGGYFLLRGRGGATQFTTATVDRGDVVEVVGATGALEAVKTVQIGSQVSGTIESLYADFNSTVKKGQVIARLDASILQARLGQARANLLAAKANVDRARSTLEDSRQKYERARELAAQKLLPVTDLETAKANYDGALAQLKANEAAQTQSQASVNQAEVDLSHTVIDTPIDGVVISRNVDVGQTVAASFQAPVLFVIANDLAQMRVNASVDEADVGRVREGEDVTFHVDAFPEREFRGVVEQVRLNPTTVSNVVSYNTIIAVDNRDLLLRPGMTATVSIIVRKAENALRLPSAALRYRPEGYQRPAGMRPGGPRTGAAPGRRWGGGWCAGPGRVSDGGRWLAAGRRTRPAGRAAGGRRRSARLRHGRRAARPRRTRAPAPGRAGGAGRAAVAGDRAPCSSPARTARPSRWTSASGSPTASSWRSATASPKGPPSSRAPRSPGRARRGRGRGRRLPRTPSTRSGRSRGSASHVAGHLIRLVDLKRSYALGDVTVHALRGVSLEIEAGAFIAVVGASGSGKSTLMNILGLLDRPTSGSYHLDGQDVSGFDRDRRADLRNKKIGFIFQNFSLLPRTTALENVELPLLYNGRGHRPAERHAKAMELLTAVSLADRAHHTPNQLSGGQQQRVAIARSLVNDPELLLADEPTGNLDSRTSVEIMEILQRLNREKGITVLLITHEHDIAEYGTRVVTVRDGRILSDEPVTRRRDAAVELAGLPPVDAEA